MWDQFTTFLKDYHLGDMAGILGLCMTFFALLASQSAAAAARQARDEAQAISSLVNFAEAISTVEEIKRLLRANALAALPERCSAARRLLIPIKNGIPRLTEDDKKCIQNSLSNLTSLEINIQQHIFYGQQISFQKIDKSLLTIVDELLEVLGRIKTNGGDT